MVSTSATFMISSEICTVSEKVHSVKGALKSGGTSNVNFGLFFSLGDNHKNIAFFFQSRITKVESSKF